LFADRRDLSTVRESDEMLALQALGWILSDEPTRERFLGMTGLTPDGLRASLHEQATLGAILRFLSSYERDLLACADALGVSAETLGEAARRWDGIEGMNA
jgi:hypothetical protein